MAKFNVINFRRETAKSRNSFKNIAYNAALAKFNGIHSQMLKDFNEDKITEELEGGENAKNISGTLGGKGNLFSFIGFNAGTNPVDIVRQALEDIRLEKVPIIEEKASIIKFKFAVKEVALNKLYDMTPLPWESGKSWLKGIEKGISGFGHYIYWKVLPNPPSFSTTGIQADNLLRDAEFSPKSYISRILNGFYKNLK